MNFRVAIDTGGTFTDAISIDEFGNMVTAKAPTTPKDLVVGTINAMEALAKRNDMDRKAFLAQVTSIVHGTTLGTNVIITRSGPKLGLIATEGHKDVLALPRIPKEDMWDWRKPQPQPLVPRYLRTEVRERVDARGEVRLPLDEDSVHRAVAYLKNIGIDGIVVALLFSFMYPEHERRVAEIIQADYPGIHVTLSSDVLHFLGEHERTGTTVIDAYIAPAIIEYTRTLVDFLEKEGFGAQLLFMQNNGGVETAAVALEKPSTLATSGPAAGPTSAITMGRLHGEENLLSVDMGGTSFDIAIVDKGNFMTKNENLIEGLRFSLPIIDSTSIGAGGGSIAWFDLADTLRVGPKSAGADPGPACYDMGGEEATVTDADVVLGYISPDYFLGGERKLRKDLAEKAIKEKVGDRLNLSITEGAAAIHKVANSVMADGINYTFTRRGYDPRDFTLVAAGAAGPSHAIKIAQELGISRVLIPKYAPIYCAFGMLCVNLKHDFLRFYATMKEDLDIGHVKMLYEDMESEALVLLEKEGVSEDQRDFERTMQVRYFGQFREVDVPWPGGPITDDAISEGLKAFHRKHGDVYGYSDENYPVEFMGFGLSAIGKMPLVELKGIARGSEDPSSAIKGERDAYFEESNGFIKTRVYDGDKLLCGNLLEGPCIVEERMTTIVVPPQNKLRIDEYGNYITV
ncbi:MAG: hydantoinase/oxoprolinase family protein [Deltaproteobacteria bacterium]|nr:hydantoinase/oxoprolinase family protein [Deltaproteobacteria bacterium]